MASKKMDIVWLVWAERGCYSDRTEYAVCWFDTKSMAEACATVMCRRSNEWRARCADSDAPWDVGEEAMKDLGDPQWAYYDDTRYYVVELQRGEP